MRLVGLIGTLVWIGWRDEGSRWVKSSRHSGTLRGFCTGSTSRIGAMKDHRHFVAWLRCRLFLDDHLRLGISASSFYASKKTAYMWVVKRMSKYYRSRRINYVGICWNFQWGKLLLHTPDHAFISLSYPKLLNHTPSPQKGV